MGTLWCGWVSDTYHLSRSVICEFSSILAGIIIITLPSSSTSTSFLSLSLLLGFFLYIPFSFSELIAIESVDTKYTNFIISMNGLMSPFGSVFSGVPVNLLIQTYGWKTIQKDLCISFIAFAILLWGNSIIRRHSMDSKDL